MAEILGKQVSPSIRLERPGDFARVESLIKIAFQGKRYADGTEHLINDRLRKAGAMTLALVAEINKAIVGQIAFSPVEIGEKSDALYALGPISVLPTHQRQGIGSRLVSAGVRQLRKMDARGIVLLGDPNYYSQFGFESYDALSYQGEPSPYLQFLVLQDSLPTGAVKFHPAFGDEAG